MWGGEGGRDLETYTYTTREERGDGKGNGGRGLLFFNDDYAAALVGGA
jgi:hypothetical protein